MRASTPRRALAALVALGCGGAPSAPDAGADACAPYQDRPAIYAYCVRRSVSQLEEASAMARCATLPEADAGACRRAWVLDALARARPPAAEALLRACDGDEDCAFEVLDRLPAADPVARLADCRAHAGRFTEDCVLHSLQVWATSKPDEAAVARLETAAAEWPAALGTAVGTLRACQGVRPTATAPDADLGCPEEPVAHSACRRTLEDAVRRAPACAGPGAIPAMRPPGGGGRRPDNSPTVR